MGPALVATVANCSQMQPSALALFASEDRQATGYARSGPHCFLTVPRTEHLVGNPSDVGNKAVMSHLSNFCLSHWIIDNIWLKYIPNYLIKTFTLFRIGPGSTLLLSKYCLTLPRSLFLPGPRRASHGQLGWSPYFTENHSATTISQLSVSPLRLFYVQKSMSILVRRWMKGRIFGHFSGREHRRNHALESKYGRVLVTNQKASNRM